MGVGEWHVRILFNDTGPHAHPHSPQREERETGRNENLEEKQSAGSGPAHGERGRDRTECRAHTEGQNKAAAHGDHVVVFKIVIGVGKTEWVQGGCESVVQKDSAEQSGER